MVSAQPDNIKISFIYKENTTILFLWLFIYIVTFIKINTEDWLKLYYLNIYNYKSCIGDIYIVPY